MTHLLRGCYCEGIDPKLYICIYDLTFTGRGAKSSSSESSSEGSCRNCRRSGASSSPWGSKEHKPGVSKYVRQCLFRLCFRSLVSLAVQQVVATYTYKDTHACIHTYIYIYMYIYMFVSVCIHAYKYIYIYVYMFTYTYVYMYVYFRPQSQNHSCVFGAMPGKQSARTTRPPYPKAAHN